MAITLRAFAESEVLPSSATYVVDKPTGTVDGDVMLAVLFDRSDTQILNSLPSGWTQLEVVETPGLAYLCTKTAGASEPSTYSFGWAGAVSGGWMIISLAGVNNSSPIEDSSGVVTSSGTTHTPATFATDEDDSMVVIMGVAKDAVGITFTQATLTEDVDDDTASILYARCMYHGIEATAGTVSAPVVSSGAIQLHLFAVALAPASVVALTSIIGVPTVSSPLPVPSTPLDANEYEIAMPMTAVSHSATIGQVVEGEVALPFQPRATIVIGQVTEDEIAQPVDISQAHHVILHQVTETESAIRLASQAGTNVGKRRTMMGIG